MTVLTVDGPVIVNEEAETFVTPIKSVAAALPGPAAVQT
jgi:hypothetical protein